MTKLDPGDWVFHPDYGHGMVIRVINNSAAVDFRNGFSTSVMISRLMLTWKDRGNA